MILKVLFVTPTYFDEQSIIGGGERYVEKFAEAMARKCELTVYSFGPKARSFERSGVKYRIFRYAAFGHFSQTNPFSIRHYFAIKHGNFDVLHTHQTCTFVNDVACLAAHRCGIPAITTDHGGGGAWVLNNRVSIYPKYAAAIGQSNIAAEILKPSFGSRVLALKGGVSLEEFVPTESSKKKKWILFVGRLLPHKGVHTLIRAFQDARLDGYELILLGRPMEETYFASLKNLAKNLRVKFVTTADDNELKRYYQQAKVTVLPSETIEGDNLPPELMGFTSLESQASGTPVVVSDGGPMAEFVDYGKTGYVFENKNIAALADALRQTLALYNNTSPDSVIHNCREWVRQFSWDALADQHLDLYRRLSAPNPKK